MKFLFPSLLSLSLIGCGGGGGDDDAVTCTTYDGVYINATRCEFDRAEPDTTDPDYQREFDDLISQPRGNASGSGGGTATPIQSNRVETPFY